jgi:hypothetical protein
MLYTLVPWPKIVSYINRYRVFYGIAANVYIALCLLPLDTYTLHIGSAVGNHNLR